MQNLLASAGSGLFLFVLIFGAAAWVRNAMAAEFARGETFGRAALAAETAAEVFVRGQAAEAALRKTNADVAALDDERDQLQEGLYALEREIGSVGDSPLCIGPRLVRAISGASGPMGDSDARPRRS